MDVESKLAELNVHPRDVIEAVWAADRQFERGTTDRTRVVVDIWRRAQAGDATPDDVEVLRRELRDDTLGGRRSYLINALHMSGYHDGALELLLELLRTSREWDDVELALRFLSEWSPATYEHLAIPFLRGVDWDKMGVRRSAMAYAGALIRRGEALSLLDELIRVATDPAESPAARSSARFALVTAAGIEWNDPIHNHIGLQSTDAEAASLVEMVRERLRRDAERQAPALSRSAMRRRNFHTRRGRRFAVRCSGETPRAAAARKRNEGERAMSDDPELYPGFVYSDLTQAIPWLEKVFGFRTLKAIQNEDGSYAHVEMAYGPIIIMPTSPQPEWGWKSPRDLGATTATVYVYVPDDQLTAHYERARSAGAEIALPLQEKPWGGRDYIARDLDGHLWSFGSYKPAFTPR